MNRRSFIIQSSILAGGLHFKESILYSENKEEGRRVYDLFRNPDSVYRPFVRWWWNGDKIERAELARELRILKEAGIGGVEINPIKFPARTDDLGKRTVPWLSDEWIELLKFTLDEARSLDITCDLIVGSGWPFGGEWLDDDERSQVITIGAKKLEGPLDYEVSLFDLSKQADPNISSPFPGRTVEMLSVLLAPAVIAAPEDVKDLSDQIAKGKIKFKIPEGKYVLYALAKIHAFAQVIQGVPGATGPVLDHYNKAAVMKYLRRMSDTIQDKIGPLSGYVHSLFTDSLELEGANWCDDMPIEFQRRRGYDIMPWLPFILYKLEGLGNTWVYDYGAEYAPAFKEMINRVRYDFELTKAELIRERFVETFTDWCKENNVKSRLQGYGRGYFLLEGTFNADIPECETWIMPGLGTEMSDSDYKVGRAYTMINKFVSSSAHLKGKKQVSCEELTNTDRVFNTTLELMKVAGDQSIVSGVTHPVFHGFNYSPPEALFPGWVIYGTFLNERNPWWRYFRKFTDYRARLSALLQNATMFADMAILPASGDTWARFGAQNEPFPVEMYPPWQTLIWESIHQNGNACDYISEQVIQDATIQNGYLVYGPRKYHSIFLTQVESMEPATAKRLFEFVQAGGRVFFIEAHPSKSPGWNDYQKKDALVQDWVEKMKVFQERCIFLNKPGKDYTAWFKDVQEKYNITPYIKIDSPNRFVSQVRYQADDVEIFVFINSNVNESYDISLQFNSNKQAWLWEPENGERYKIIDKEIKLDMGPADLKILVFEKKKSGPVYHCVKEGKFASQIKTTWSLTGNHIDGRVIQSEMTELKDLKELPEWVNFCGTVVYQNRLLVEESEIEYLNLGKVVGVSELGINGINAGTKWYGRRIYRVKNLLKQGENLIEVRVVTTMGNYMKSLTDNKIAQYWTNEGRKIQPLESMGLIGPVTIY